MTLKYYLHLYSCYFRSTNIFGYSFGKYVAIKYIWIFVWYILVHPNTFGYSFVSILRYLLITGPEAILSGAQSPGQGYFYVLLEDTGYILFLYLFSKKLFSLLKKDRMLSCDGARQDISRA